MDKETSHGFHATSADNKVISEELENVHHSGDVYDADLSFTVGKSPMQEGDLTTKKMNNVGGLGEGTPKVVFFHPVEVLWSRFIMYILTFLFSLE